MNKLKIIKIAIVEDDLYFNKALTRYIQNICNHLTYPRFEFEITSFLNAQDCIEQLDENTNIMILDYYLINEDEEEVLNGHDVLKAVKQYCPSCKVIMLSSLKNSHIAANLMKEGIYEYIDKNISSRNRIGAVVQKAISDPVY